MRTLARLLLIVPAAVLLPCRAAAQNANILLPVDSIERLLRIAPFDVTDRHDTRFEGDRTQRVVLVFSDSSLMRVKWAKAARGGQGFNNQPRYELAAYELQKLFLDEPDFVVPPTIARALPVGWYRVFEPEVEPTFDDAASVLVVLQYWLWGVTNQGVYDRGRLERDTAYARSFANLNLLTHLIWHSDANDGNILISEDSPRPRLFSVDNGVAFSSPESDRGVVWRRLRTDRLPRAAVERLRGLTREDLEGALGVVAQFEVRDGQLVPVERTANLREGAGVRQRDAVIQLGLTAGEIRRVHARIEAILRNVDRGRIQTF